MTTDKKIDLFVTILLLTAGALISYVFHLQLLIGAAIYTLAPIIYLLTRKQKNISKLLLAAGFLGVIGFFFDFWESFNNAWTANNLTIPYRILGIAAVQDLIEFILMSLLILVFYEHFLDDEKNKRISKNFFKTLVFSFIFIFSAICIFELNPDLFRIKYSYFWAGIIAVAFILYFITKYKKFLPKLIIISAFFFFVWFTAEIVGLKNGGWSFPGHYVGMVSILGVSFPFEELFFWMGLYAPAIIAAYELSVDDLK